MLPKIVRGVKWYPISHRAVSNIRRSNGMVTFSSHKMIPTASITLNPYWNQFHILPKDLKFCGLWHCLKRRISFSGLLSQFLIGLNAGHVNICSICYPEPQECLPNHSPWLLIYYLCWFFGKRDGSLYAPSAASIDCFPYRSRNDISPLPTTQTSFSSQRRFAIGSPTIFEIRSFFVHNTRR